MADGTPLEQPLTAGAPRPRTRAARLRGLWPALACWIVAGSPLAADVTGTWLTDRRDGVVGVVTIAPCGGALCGVIQRGIDEAGREVDDHVGRVVVRGMVPTGPAAFAGEVLDPRNGRVYQGRMTQQGSRLVLEGCVLGGLICGRSLWTRP